MSCDGTEVLPEFVVDARKPKGNYSQTYTGIRAGSTCSAEQITDGSTSTIDVVPSGDVGTSVIVPAGGLASLHITDTYSVATGSLLVTKNIDGPAAGSQGEVKISVSCGGTALDEIVIPAGQRQPVSQTYDDIPAGSTCTVDETVGGSTSTVSVTTVVHQPLPIAAGQEATADITNTYDFKPGSLTVEKVVGGPGAGQQGQITVTTTCLLDSTSTTLSPPLVVPAKSPAGTYTETYDNIPAGSQCTAHVSSDGSNAQVADLEDGDGTAVPMPPGGTITIQLTDNYEIGELVVNKTINGAAAGLQGQVVIHTVCNGTALTPDFIIPADTAGGTYNQTYPGILVGASCTVTETSDGATSSVSVLTTGSPHTVTISADHNATADLFDTYTQVPGSLKVTKTIWGPAAGSQGQVTIEVSCDGTELSPPFVVNAGKPLGNFSHIYNGIPAGSMCSAEETENGGSSAVSVVTSGDVGTPVPVPAGGFAYLHITDTYTHANGSLIVNKAIDGPAAGQQGEITIEVSCDGNRLEDFVIPAGQLLRSRRTTLTCPPVRGALWSKRPMAAPATSQWRTRAAGPRSPSRPGRRSRSTSRTPTSPGPVVNKTITGGAAGSQGEVRIAVTCDEAGAQTPQPDFVIPAGTPGGTVSMSYPNVLAGSTCALTETATGATETATAMTVGSPQEVTISENGTATANVVNTYEYVPGALIVTEDIAGPAAGQQGEISIGVSCVFDGATTALDPFVIPASQPAGLVSHTYEGIPAGSACTVTETENGSTSTVSVETIGYNQTLAVPARDEVVANITDTYYLAPPAPGGLTVTKTISGPAAGQQGPVTISVSCGSTALPDFVIPANTPATTVSRSYTGIATGSTCTVTETGNGGSGAVHVVTDGSPQTLNISANSTAVANITDYYSNATIPVGSLTITKDITGPAAGQQGPIAVTASCDGRALSPTLDIPAGATGVQSQTYSNIPAGSVCSATAGPTAGQARSRLRSPATVTP